MKRTIVAFKAHQGWANAVVVGRSGTGIDVLCVRRVEAGDPADRETTEPYHVAAGFDGLTLVPRPPDPAAVIRRGRRKQERRVEVALEALRRSLEQSGWNWTRAVVLTGRGWLSEDLEHTLAAHAHVHVAEGEAIRDALRAGVAKLKLDCLDQDEKSVRPAAQAKLECSDDELKARMKAARPADARSWRQEEQLVALAAWLNC